MSGIDAAAFAGVLFWSVVVFLGACLLCLAAGGAVGALARRASRNEDAALAQQASDHDEPTREDVEAAVDSAFLDAMTDGRPHLRAVLDAQREAARVDDEWESIQRNGWSA